MEPPGYHMAHETTKSTCGYPAVCAADKGGLEWEGGPTIRLSARHRAAVWGRLIDSSLAIMTHSQSNRRDNVHACRRQMDG
jgi:hypothetical protein